MCHHPRPMLTATNGITCFLPGVVLTADVVTVNRRYHQNLRPQFGQWNDAFSVMKAHGMIQRPQVNIVIRK